MPNLSKLKKIKCSQDILVQSWGLILSNSNWIRDAIGTVQWKSAYTNWLFIHTALTEWIHYDELLTTTTTSHKQQTSSIHYYYYQQTHSKWRIVYYNQFCIVNLSCLQHFIDKFWDLNLLAQKNCIDFIQIIMYLKLIRVLFLASCLLHQYF